MSRQEGLFCSGHVTQLEPDAPELCQRPAQLSPEVWAQLLTGRQDFAFGLWRGAAPSQELRPVDSAAAVDAAHGLVLMPVLHRHRPLFRQVVLPERLEG